MIAASPAAAPSTPSPPAAMAPLSWLYAVARKAVPPSTSNGGGGDWYKPVVATACVAAVVALLNMWSDTKIIRADLQELKAAAGQQEKDLADLGRRVLRLEVREQAGREALRMLGARP
jgi:hypothetical protein